MSHSNSWDWKDRKKVGMGERVARVIPILKETALVHVEEREIIGYLEVYRLLAEGDPEEKDFIKWLKKVAIPSMQILGRTKWYRDTLTDLSLGLSYGKKDKKATVDTRGLLEDETE